MSRLIFGLLWAFTSFSSFAGTSVVSMVHDVDIEPTLGAEALIFLSTGQVGKVDLHDLELIEELRAGQERKAWYNFQLSEDREIIGFEEVESPVAAADESYAPELKSAENYTPTVLKGMTWANTYFWGARSKAKDSQCFNRAHVWSYEWFKKHNIISGKIFLFFTAKYIREANFGWWFHMAPYVHVAVGTNIKERVMDRKHTKGPSTVHQWIKTFIKEGHPCATVSTYSHYANYPESNYCYIMRTSMYYYWPLDLEREELFGIKRSGWDMAELKAAYLEAFNMNI